MDLVKVKLLKATQARKKDDVVEVDQLRAKAWADASVAKVVK